MEKLLDTGTMLENRFRIADILGYSDTSAAYLAADLDTGGAWTLVWESLEIFRIRQKPQGVLQYLELGGRHYLVLRLEGLDLGLVYSAAGILEEGWAALWLSQVCAGVGQWHARAEDPVVCLEVGDLRLADMRLMATAQAILPSYNLLADPVKVIVPGHTLAFSAPEKMMQEPLTSCSDVYALGAALYCLVTGDLPPDPRALAEGQTNLVPPRKINQRLSSRVEKAILKAMSPNPDQRQESAMQLSFELDRCVPRRLRRQKL